MADSIDRGVGVAIFGATIGAASLLAAFAKTSTKIAKPKQKKLGEILHDTFSVFQPLGDLPKLYCDDDEVLKYYLPENILDPTWSEEPSVIDHRDGDTPDRWIPRHPDLIRLTGRHPFNCEAPLARLHEKGFITPNALHYVRSHGATPNIKWREHAIYIGGHAPKAYKLNMMDLLSFKRHSLPVTLVCCGNRRKEQNMIKKSIGFNWGAAGVSNGVWTGVRLIDLLAAAGVTHANQFKASMHVRFASENEKGGDKLPGGVYGTSVPLEKALDPTADIIIAYLYNGKLLSPDHGFPVRLIVPGYIGGRMIKWLTNIDLLETESQDYYHFHDNRVLPTTVTDPEMAKADGWWYKPEYICNELNINSAIAAPDHDESLQTAAGGTYAIKGYAYTGGGRKITRAEISLDSGATWLLTDLNLTERPSAYGKYWCWCFWEIRVTHEALSNAHEIVLRAWDSGHNTQPDKPTWNLMGMLNNPWFRIKIHRYEVDGITMLTFEHPTLAGNQSGGWMQKVKGDALLTSPGVYQPKSSFEESLPAISSSEQQLRTEVAPSAVADIFDPSKPSYSIEEVQQHASAESAWIVVSNKVYDCTPFLKAHPGGAESILISAGTDCTEEFEAIHSKKAWKMLDEYLIGQLRPADLVTNAPAQTSNLKTLTATTTSAELIALDPKQRLPFKMVERIQLSPDSILMRFELPSPQHKLGLPVGQHVLVSAKIDGKLVMRAYTPTSSDHDLGHFDLLIKIYYANKSAQFPEGGKLSQYLGSLQVGSTVDFKGPLGHVTYQGQGRLHLGGIDVRQVRTFVMLCGGTGITPIYQVMQAVLRDEADATKLIVIYANRTESDILLRPELDAMLSKHGGARLRLHYILSQPLNAAAWVASSGHLKEAGAMKTVDSVASISTTTTAESGRTSPSISSVDSADGPDGSGAVDGTVADKSVGRVSSTLVHSMFPPGGPSSGCVALLCGPQTFLNEACAPALLSHGYATEDCVYF